MLCLAKVRFALICLALFMQCQTIQANPSPMADLSIAQRQQAFDQQTLAPQRRVVVATWTGD